MSGTRLERAFSFSTKHPRTVIAVTLALTAVFGFFAARIRINADYASLLPRDADVNRLIEEYGGTQSGANLLVVALKGEDLFRPDTLSAFSGLVTEIAALPIVTSSISPFNFFVFEKSREGRVQIKRTTETNSAPSSPEEIERFRRRLLESRFAVNIVVSKDATMLAAFFFTEKRDDYSGFMKDVNERIARTRTRLEGATVHTSGLVPLGDRTRFYISRDVGLLVVLAALVVILFYYIGFRTRRSLFLPLTVVLFSTVWAVGLMSVLGYSLTLISIVAPPLILIFGNEYAIYVMSEYYRLARRAEPELTDRHGILIDRTVATVAKPIALAFVTTIVGFLSLCVTDIHQTREFAVIASFGSLASGLIAIFFLPAVLSLFADPGIRKAEKAPASASGVARASTASEAAAAGQKAERRNRLLDFLVRATSRRPGWILLLVPAIAALFFLALPRLMFNTDSINYFPKEDPVISDMYVLTESIGGFDELSVTFLAPEGKQNHFLDPAVIERLMDLEDEIRKNPDVCYTSSFPSYLGEINRVQNGSEDAPLTPGFVRYIARILKAAASDEIARASLGGLFNDDFTRLTLKMRIYNSDNGHFIDEERFRGFLVFLEDTLNKFGYGEDSRVIWGEIMRSLSLADSLRGDLIVSMIISLGLILLITTINFGSLFYGFYAALPLILGLMCNFAFMAFSRIPLDMTTIMVSNVTIGVGIDNAFYLVVQYRRGRGSAQRSFASIIEETLDVVMKPTFLSTVSIAMGLLVFALAAFKPIVYFGLLVIFSLSATAICTLLVLPAVLAVDHRIRFKTRRTDA